MSPNVGNFVHDLVEMAKATERLPGLERENEQLHLMVEDYAKTIQAREIRILELGKELEEKASTIRNLEVARDDAELRFLEADDRMGKIASAFQVALEAMDHTDKVIEQAKEALHPTPPMPEVAPAQPVDPKPEQGYSEVPLPVNTEGWSPNVSTTTETIAAPSTSTEAVAMSSDPTNVDSWASGPGQSEALPTTASTQTDEAPQTSANNSATKSEDAGLQTKPSGRYSGRRYYDWATYVPLHQWLAEGGTEEDYNWRPERLPMRGRAD